MRGCVRLQWIFFFEDSFNTSAHFMMSDLQVHPLIPHWVFSSFWPKMAWPLCPTLPIHLISPQTTFFCLFAQRKNVLKGKHFADVEEVKQKMAETLNGIKIDEFKNCFEQWKKVSIGVLHQMKSTLKVRTPLNTCVTSHSYVSSQCLSFLISKMAK